MDKSEYAWRCNRVVHNSRHDSSPRVLLLVGQGLEPTKVGSYIGAVFVLLSNVLWASTYIFRVANKDMTYAKQLRDYENAVLEKRL